MAKYRTRGDKRNRPELDAWKPLLAPAHDSVYPAGVVSTPTPPPLSANSLASNPRPVRRKNFTTSLHITEALRLYSETGKIKDAATYLMKCSVPVDTSASVLRRTRWRKHDPLVKAL